MTEQQSEHTHRFRELIKDIRFAMFTTRQADGSLRSRPMTTQNDPEDPEGNQPSLYFFASLTGEPVADLQRDPAVNVGYADPGRDSYVSVSGKATVVDDADRKKRLWSKFAEAWFPGGPEDPDLALVRVQIEQAEYWNVKESKVTQLFKMARANLTKEPPTDMGEHGRVDL
jgi:general stress protein 26